MVTKDELLDKLTEQYKQADDICNDNNRGEEERFFYATMCNAYAQVFARVHATFYPTIPEGAGGTILIRSHVALHTMQAVSLPIVTLDNILTKAFKAGVASTDLVHLVTDNDLLTAYLIEPHLENRQKEIHCSKSIYNTQRDEAGN